MEKHSVTISGHATSITLEPEFWTELKRIAKHNKQSLASLIEAIDAGRKPAQNLSSALRVYILVQLKNQSAS